MVYTSPMPLQFRAQIPGIESRMYYTGLWSGFCKCSSQKDVSDFFLAIVRLYALVSRTAIVIKNDTMWLWARNVYCG
jgi:hypothetical protein